MNNMRERIAATKKKKQMADEATKSLSSKGKASKGTTKATVDGKGRKLTKCLDRAVHNCVGDNVMKVLRRKVALEIHRSKICL